MSKNTPEIIFHFEIFKEGLVYNSHLETAKTFTAQELQVIIQSMAISLTNLIKMQAETQHGVTHDGTTSKNIKNFGDGLE